MSFASCLSYSSGQKQARTSAGGNEEHGVSSALCCFIHWHFEKNNAEGHSGDNGLEKTDLDPQKSAFVTISKIQDHTPQRTLQNEVSLARSLSSSLNFEAKLSCLMMHAHHPSISISQIYSTNKQTIVTLYSNVAFTYYFIYPHRHTQSIVFLKVQFMVNQFSWLLSNMQLRLPINSQFIITWGRPRFLFSLELFSSLPFIVNTRNVGAACIRNPLEIFHCAARVAPLAG